MKLAYGIIALFASVLISPIAEAHISVASAPAAANKSQEVTFNVGHGCNGLDTYRLRIEIPAGVTSVRALSSELGKPVVTKNETDAAVAMTWEKPLADLEDSDVNLYRPDELPRPPERGLACNLLPPGITLS